MPTPKKPIPPLNEWKSTVAGGFIGMLTGVGVSAAKMSYKEGSSSASEDNVQFNTQFHPLVIILAITTFCALFTFISARLTNKCLNSYNQSLNKTSRPSITVANQVTNTVTLPPYIPPPLPPLRQNPGGLEEGKNGAIIVGNATTSINNSYGTFK